tara:strand:- start:934 stop:1176 length:243 start_codon:yes stop_codon:yes gene_type:complete
MITIYSRKGCPYCEKFIAIVEMEELNHVVYKLDRDFTREEFSEKFGEGSTFPQILYNDIHIGGCKEGILYLQENNICCTV